VLPDWLNAQGLLLQELQPQEPLLLVLLPQGPLLLVLLPQGLQREPLQQVLLPQVLLLGPRVSAALSFGRSYEQPVIPMPTMAKVANREPNHFFIVV